MILQANQRGTLNWKPAQPASPYRWLGNKPKWWLEIPTLGNWLWDTMRRANLWVQVSCHGLERCCWEKENHLQNAILGGYVSSLEGRFTVLNLYAFSCLIFLDISKTSAADRSTSSWLLWWSGFFGWDPPKSVSWICFNEDPVYPAGGFKYLLFSPLPGKMIQFD